MIGLFSLSKWKLSQALCTNHTLWKLTGVAFSQWSRFFWKVTVKFFPALQKWDSRIILIKSKDTSRQGKPWKKQKKKKKKQKKKKKTFMLIKPPTVSDFGEKNIPKLKYLP